jgi:carbon monoxide dehydrogenase subunit G
MKLDGTFTFAAPRAGVWDLLQDPAVLAKALPGTKRLDKTAPDRFEGLMNVTVGPVTAAEFAVTVTMKDQTPPDRFVLAIDGKGAVGFTRGTVSIDLSDADGGGTVLRYASDVQVGGRIAAVGQRLIETVARSMTRQALDSLNREIASRTAGA